MKILKYITEIILILLLLNSCDWIFKGDTTTVSGIVTDHETGEPIDSVLLTIKEHVFMNGTFLSDYTTYTNSKGEYELSFKQDESIEYSINIKKDYYMYKECSSGLSLREGRTQTKDISLYRYGRTTAIGKITDKETNLPINNARIMLCENPDDTLNTKIIETTSNSTGYYHFYFTKRIWYNDYFLIPIKGGYIYKSWHTSQRNYDVITAEPSETQTINFEMEKID